MWKPQPKNSIHNIQEENRETFCTVVLDRAAIRSGSGYDAGASSISISVNDARDASAFDGASYGSSFAASLDAHRQGSRRVRSDFQDHGGRFRRNGDARVGSYRR